MKLIDSTQMNPTVRTAAESLLKSIENELKSYSKKDKMHITTYLVSCLGGKLQDFFEESDDAGTIEIISFAGD